MRFSGFFGGKKKTAIHAVGDVGLSLYFICIYDDKAVYHI